MRKSSSNTWRRRDYTMSSVAKFRCETCSLVFLYFSFFFFFAQRTEFPSLPLSIRQILVKIGNESKMAEVPVDYPIPIGRFFTKTWRKRDVERRCGESRWINLCLVTICRFHEVGTFAFDILSESIVHLRIRAAVPSEINNYVCCARNIGRLINRLSVFTREGRDSRY